jgi:PAS domain-containing protein
MTEQVGYEAAFRTAPQALLLTDGAGVVRLVNAEAERLFRRDAAEVARR